MKLLHRPFGSDSGRQIWRNVLSEELVRGVLCLPYLDHAPSSFHRVRGVQYETRCRPNASRQGPKHAVITLLGLARNFCRHEYCHDDSPIRFLHSERDSQGTYDAERRAERAPVRGSATGTQERSSWALRSNPGLGVCSRCMAAVI